MLFDNIKKLLTGILICLILLTICIAVDYADVQNNETNNANITVTQKNIKTTKVNDTYIIDDINQSSFVASSSDKVYYDCPEVTIRARPSCGCNHGYYWHTRTFVDYCPHCHRYGVLKNVHKYPARHEQELTCTHCGADYCGVCGKEKYSWSHYRLERTDWD